MPGRFGHSMDFLGRESPRRSEYSRFPDIDCSSVLKTAIHVIPVHGFCTRLPRQRIRSIRRHFRTDRSAICQHRRCIGCDTLSSDDLAMHTLIRATRCGWCSNAAALKDAFVRARRCDQLQNPESEYHPDTSFFTNRSRRSQHPATVHR